MFPISPRPITCSKGLNEIGIDYLFCNFGTDHAPIIDEMAHRRKRGEPMPGDGALSAREHGRAHGGRLCARHRTRPGRAGPCRRRHREYRKRHAQSVPQPAAGAADGGQGALYGQRRACRLARHLRAFRAGAVRPGEPGAAIPEMGMDAAVGRRRQGGAAARVLDHAERAARPGLSDDAARDADAALERRRDPALYRRSICGDVGRRRRSEARRRTRRQAFDGGESDPDHRLCRTSRACARAPSTRWRNSPASPSTKPT